MPLTGQAKREWSRDYRQRNRKRLTADARQWRERNRQKHREYMRNYMRSHRLSNP